jgi:hypothetical protein
MPFGAPKKNLSVSAVANSSFGPISIVAYFSPMKYSKFFNE